MSIAGISGVATKTSFALFFLRVLTASPAIVGEGAANLRVLVFNVKGEDLLWLDKPNRLFDEAPRARPRAGRRSGSSRRRSPASASGRRRDAACRELIPDTGGRLEGIDVFAWTPREFVDLGLLEFCFTDANDAKNQLPFIRERVQQQLRRFAVDVAGTPGAVALRDPRDQPDGRWHEPSRPARPGTVITDLPTLVDGARRVPGSREGEPDAAWTGRVQLGTVSAFLRRLHAAASRIGHLVRAGESRGSIAPRANVTVVAIQSLHEQAQRFVVGALLQETFEEKEATGQRLPLSVIVLDELNKYAPARRHEPAEGHADRHRPARTVPRRAAGRRAADGEPGGARGARERLDPGERPSGRRGGRTRRVRLDAPLHARAGTAAQARDDGGEPARGPRAAGRDVPLPAVGDAQGGGARRRRRRSVRRASSDPPMRILHTADWHVGRRLGRHDRTDESARRSTRSPRSPTPRTSTW